MVKICCSVEKVSTGHQLKQNHVLKVSSISSLFSSGDIGDLLDVPA